MSSSLFFKQLEKAKQDQLDRAAMVVRAVAMDLYTQLTTETPIDTGRAKGNWSMSRNAPSTGVNDISSPAEANSENRTQAASIKIELGDVVWFSNNVSYIRRLNEGSSKQAPAGFVERAVKIAQGRLEELVG